MFQNERQLKGLQRTLSSPFRGRFLTLEAVIKWACLLGRQLFRILPAYRQASTGHKPAAVHVAGHQGKEAAALQLLDLVVDGFQLTSGMCIILQIQD